MITTNGNGRFSINIDSFLMFFTIVARFSPLAENDYVFILAILVSFIGLLHNRVQLLHTMRAYTFWIFSFLTLYLLSMFWTIDSTNTLRHFIATLGRYIIVLYWVSCFKNEKRFKSICLAYVISIAIVYLIDMALLGPFFLYNSRLLEYNSIAGNNNQIAKACAIGLFLLYTLNFKSRRIVLPISLLFLFLIISSGSKTSFALLVIMFSVYYIKNNRNYLVHFTVVILISFLSYFFISNVPILYNMIGGRLLTTVQGIISLDSFSYLTSDTVRQTGLSTSDATRLNYIVLGLGWLKEKYIVGYGMASFKVLLGVNMYAHNNYIEIGVGLGIVGLLIYYSMHFRILLDTLSNNYLKNEQSISLAIIIALLVTDLSSVSYLSIESMFLVGISYFNLKNQGRI